MCSERFVTIWPHLRLNSSCHAAAAFLAGAIALVALPSQAAPIAAPSLPIAGPERAVIHKAVPKYPPGAERRGITGWVLLEFSVDGAGNVVAPRAIEGSPPGVFDSVALQSITKWKYEATGANTRAVQVKMKFELK